MKKICVNVEPGSAKHLSSLMLKYDITRKALASDYKCSQAYLNRAFNAGTTDHVNIGLRGRLIDFIERNYENPKGA